MKRFKLLLLLAVGALSLTAYVRGTEKTFSLPAEAVTLKNAPGVELAGAQCLLCHSPDYIGTQPKLNRTVWKAEVTKMQQKYGAQIITNRVDELVDYLVKNYGQENPTPKEKSK